MLQEARLILPLILFLNLLGTVQTGSASVQPPATSAPEQSFNVKTAVDAYLAKMPPAQRTRSDAYFEGGYWLMLWDFLLIVFVLWLMLHFRWSARMRNVAERITRFKPIQTALYWIQFILVFSVLTFPLGVCEGYFREHRYGLLNQNFGEWMRDQVVMLAVVLVLGLGNMLRGGSPNLSQTLMRWRVTLQFIAIVVIMLAVWAMGR